MKVGIVDYQIVNLGSVFRAFTTIGAHTVIASAPDELAGVDLVVLPGVGSFGDGMHQLEAGQWPPAIRASVARGTPLLGICLGMHLLAEAGTEGGHRPGLGLLPGAVKRLDTLGCEERIPHVGWNEVESDGTRGGLFEGIPSGTDFYFVHSYVLEVGDGGRVLGRTTYGATFTSAAAYGRVFGTQFHPEKSSKPGLQLLRNFLAIAAC